MLMKAGCVHQLWCRSDFPSSNSGFKYPDGENPKNGGPVHFLLTTTLQTTPSDKPTVVSSDISERLSHFPTHNSAAIYRSLVGFASDLTNSLLESFYTTNGGFSRLVASFGFPATPAKS